MKQPLNINKDEIATKVQRMSIEWRLHPPSGLHFGGVWERLVSIIKRVFLLNLGSDSPSSDIFSTVEVECEGLINSRPLTHVSCDINDILPLTPNHFLLGRPFIYAPAAAIHLRSRSFNLRPSKYQETKQQILEVNQGPTRQLLEATTKRIRPNPDQTSQVEPKTGNHGET